MRTLQLESYQIVVPDELEAYNDFRKKYRDKALVISKEFDEKFTIIFDDMDEVYEKFPVIALDYLADMADFALRDVVNAGIMDVSEEVFIKEYVAPRSIWQKYFSVIEDQYMEIVLDSEKYEEYKNARDKNSSPEVMGGGFGIEGAAAGMAIATASNLAISAVSGILNSASDGLRAWGEKTKKEELFYNPETRKNVVNSIFNLVFQVHLSVIDLIVAKNGYSEFAPISPESQLKSKALVENINKGRIEQEKQKDSLVNSINIDPYNEKAYKLWLEKYGDNCDDIFNIIVFFGVNRIKIEKNYRDYKKHESGYRSQSKDSEGREVYSSDEKDAEVRDELIFDGKVYETKEDAERVRAEYIEKFLNSDKDFDKAKRDELKKIFKDDEAVNRANLFGGLGFIACILLSVFHSPWWHGVVSFFIFLIPFITYSNFVEKKALERWLERYKAKN